MFLCMVENAGKSLASELTKSSGKIIRKTTNTLDIIEVAIVLEELKIVRKQVAQMHKPKDSKGCYLYTSKVEWNYLSSNITKSFIGRSCKQINMIHEILVLSLFWILSVFCIKLILLL